MKNKIRFLAIGAALAAGPAYAGAPGANTYQFLQLDANARPVGMGGAYTALADDANALRYNPAGLGLVHRHEGTFMHNQYFQDISQEYLAYASPWGLGANLNMLKFGDVPRTTNSNPNGTGLGSETLSAMAFTAGYGRALTPALAVGGGAKFIRQTIAGVVGQGYAADLGVLYETPFVERLRLAMAFQNLGPAVKYQSAKEKLPTTIRFGTAYPFQTGALANTLSFDVVNELRMGTNFAFGAETLIMGRGAVRMGYDGSNEAGPGITVGMGLILDRFSFDYAFVPFGELGTAHRLSFSMRWGASRDAERPERSERPARASTPGVSPAGLLRDAEGAVASGRYDAAGTSLDRLERMRPSEGDIVAHIAVLRGEAALAQGQLNRASAYFEDASENLSGLKAGDLASRAFAGLARIAFKAGDSRKTAELLRKALEAAPDEDYADQLRADFRKLRSEGLKKK